MNTDIRISVSFKNHRKRKKLTRILGIGSDIYLIDLWITVAMDCPEGILFGWDKNDIADSCNWNDDPKILVDALIECNFLEKDSDGNYSIHDWCEHQGWACKAKERSIKAKKAAEARWNQENANSNAQAMLIDANSNAQANAPILSYPNLSYPNLSKKYSDKQKPFVEEFEKFWNMYDKKVDRKKSEKKFIKLKKSDIEKIFETLPAYIKSTPDKQYRKNPSTYLNNQSWNDEIQSTEPVDNSIQESFDRMCDYYREEGDTEGFRQACQISIVDPEEVIKFFNERN
jgi:hypothetical protein